MNNLSEEIIAKFLMGKCTEEELVQVNLWIKESDENARKLFRMEEIYHLGKEKHTVSPKRMDQAERSLYKRLAIEEAKQNRTLAIHRWMKYAAIITVILLTGTGITYWIGQNALINNKMIAVASEVAASLPAAVLQGLESLKPVLIISLISSKLSLLRSSSASWYRACRDDWNTGSSSQPRPSHSRSRIMVSAAPGTTRGSSMSSMRSRMESPDLRAESHAPSMA